MSIEDLSCSSQCGRTSRKLPLKCSLLSHVYCDDLNHNYGTSLAFVILSNEVHPIILILYYLKYNSQHEISVL